MLYLISADKEGNIFTQPSLNRGQKFDVEIVV